jgi:UDP-galactopyranose mutase
MADTQQQSIAIVGAGFSGAVIARELAENGLLLEVFDERDHVGGNCHTYRDAATGIMVHTYGPHIFHTDDQEVWEYVNGFAEFKPFVNRVKAISGGRVYSLPINLHTINQFFGKTLNPADARRFLESKADLSIQEPRTFEEQALRFVGPELYAAFFRGYTRKQWGVQPSELPASVLKRLPVRFNYDDNYFDHKFQGMPRDGYTDLVETILQHPRISVFPGRRFRSSDSGSYRHTFYSGPIDGFFDYQHGLLGYRTLDFEPHIADGNFQGNAVINYCDEEVRWTRISEHKHFAPWEAHQKTICFREYSRACSKSDIPFYPIRLVDEKRQLSKYIDAASCLKGVSFVGRLGTYRYLDMDVTIREALDAARGFIENARNGRTQPVFFCDPS